MVFSKTTFEMNNPNSIVTTKNQNTSLRPAYQNILYTNTNR